MSEETLLKIGARSAIIVLIVQIAVTMTALAMHSAFGYAADLPTKTVVFESGFYLHWVMIAALAFVASREFMPSKKYADDAAKDFESDPDVTTPPPL